MGGKIIIIQDFTEDLKALQRRRHPTVKRTTTLFLYNMEVTINTETGLNFKASKK